MELHKDIQKYYSSLLYRSLEDLSIEAIVSFSDEHDLASEIKRCFLQKLDCIEEKLKRVRMYEPGNYLSEHFEKKLAKML